MCLSKIATKKEQKEIISQLEHSPSGYVVGYKVFNDEGGGLFRSVNHKRKKRCWINEVDYRLIRSKLPIHTSNGKPYQTGWHIYISLQDAKREQRVLEKTHKILVKDICAYGYDYIHKLVIVSKQIYIQAEV